MYYNLWNVGTATSHYFSDCSSNQGTFEIASWLLGSKCPSNYSILKASLTLQILTTTGGCVSIILKRGIMNMKAPKYGARRSLIILYAFIGTLSTTEKNSKWVKLAKVSNTKVRRDKVG